MRILILLLLFACSSPQTTKTGGYTSSSRGTPTLSPKKATTNYKSVEEILKNLKVKENEIGFALYDVAAKEMVATKNQDELFTPASVSKMISGYYAMERLGPNYRFKTELKIDGRGNLYLIGSGDPYLFSHDLMELVLELKHHLKKAPANFYYDDFLFEPRNEVEHGQEDGETYNPSISALSSDYNLFHYHQQYRKDDNTIEFFTSPSFTKKDFRYGENFTYLGFLESLRQEAWLVPEDAKNTKMVLPHKNAAFTTASMLRFFADRNGIHLPMPTRKKAPVQGLKLVASHQSPELKTVMTLGMEFSNNFIFEQLFMSAAAKDNFGISQEEAQVNLSDFYKHKLPKVRWDGFYIKNGSGLSHDSKVSPHQLLSIVKLSGNQMLTTMPIGGYKGTLENRFIEPPLNFNIWAKTGTMDFVSSLAGTFFTEFGKKFHFAILMNKKTEANGKEVSREVSKDQWNREARRVQEELVKFWVLSN